MYLLSHAGVKKRRYTITWVGDLSYSKLKIEKTDFHIKCPECSAVFQRLIRFVDGWVAKPPPIKMDLNEEPDGWKYWLDHVRGY